MYYTRDTILFLNGKFIKAVDAHTDLYSQTLHYGFGAFEGIRAYNTMNGVKIFKAYEHYELRKNKKNPAAGLSHVFVKSGYEQIRVELNDIWYAESNGNYVVLVLENKKITSRLSMSEAEALLPTTDFIRVHRSYIVSKRHIRKTDKKSIWIHQTEIPIGAAYISEIEKIIK